MVEHNRIVHLNPGKSVAAKVRGETVKAANGDEMGEIDRVIIDPAHSRIAYLLRSRSGFLGMGEEWVPVPSQALARSDKDDAYLLNSNAEVKQMSGMQKAMSRCKSGARSSCRSTRSSV